MDRTIRTVIFIGVISMIAVMVNTSNAQEDKSYLNAPQLIKDPALTVEHSPATRKFTGIPSLAVTEEGRMWAIWYTGPTPGEDQNNYVVVSTSGDKGKTWKEVLAIDPDGSGPVRAYDPEVWVDPDRRLWIFWAQAIRRGGAVAGVWTLIIDDPESGDPVWPQPRRLTDGVMMCKPTVLTTGEWVLPVSFWGRKQESAAAVVSLDHGKTWQVRGAVTVPEEVKNPDEHMIVERRDGSLWMLVRTSYGIGESTSEDRGRTWSPLTPSKIEHPHARFFIRRLNSGNLLLVKHGPIDMQLCRSQRALRTHLTAFISKDDGETWTGGLLLDERRCSYPDGQQSVDGRIYIIYDHGRGSDQEILMASFTEKEAMAGDYWSVLYHPGRKISGKARRRMLVGRGGVKND